MTPRRLLVPLVLAPALLGFGACPQSAAPDAAVTDGGEDDGGTPILRDVAFAQVPPGEVTMLTLAGVTLTAGPYQGGQIVQVQDFLGEGPDLGLSCGAVAVRAPELHRSLALTFNDDNATLLVSVYDQAGQLLTPRPIDTRADAQAVGIMRVDPVYKRLTAMVPAGATQLIGSLSIASCAGFLHEIVLQ